MSDKITISFEIDEKYLDLFTGDIREKFEYSCKQATRYKACSTDSETKLYRKYKAQANGYSDLWLACIKGLLEIGHAK